MGRYDNRNIIIFFALSVNLCHSNVGMMFFIENVINNMNIFSIV